SLKDERNVGRQQSERRRLKEPFTRHQARQTLTTSTIADLVMILGKHHELFGCDAARWPAVESSPVGGPVPIEHVTLTETFGYLLETAVVLVIAVPFASQERVQGVVKVVAPLGIEPQPTCLYGADIARI